ncbi:MAG: sulfatase-like hydrolase/transferase [Bacteroidota bacterium]
MKYLFFPLLMTVFSCDAPIETEIQVPPTLKNVLFIISDDLATHAVGCYGNDIIRTPNIDALAASGVRFERAYANSPMCTPSRATLMTGLYPHNVGVTLLRTPLADSAYTLAEHLKSYDFSTGIFGKTHFNSGKKHGFDTLVDRHHHRDYLKKLSDIVLTDTVSHKVRPPWKPFQDSANIWLNADGATSGRPFEHSEGTFFANSAIDFIKRHQDERFLAVASFYEPHSPFNFPIEYQGKYDKATIDLPKTSQEDNRWIPAIFRGLTEEEKVGITRAYYSSVEYMDRNVGMLLTALEELGIAEETLVVFVGDHGYLLNHHGRFEKHMMWEEAVCTPLIVKGLKENISIEQPVELADIVPTITTALAVEEMSNLHGKALQPIIDDPAQTHRDAIFSVYYVDNKAMVIQDNWKYIFTSGKRDLGDGYATGFAPSSILHRLYDLENDPQERRDVAALSENAERLTQLQQLMLEKFRVTHPYAATISTTLSVDEQLSLFCEPPERRDGSR